MPAARNTVLVRLGKAAGSGQTGVLHLPGGSGGAIYLSRGIVAYAESGRTPDLATRLETATAAAYAGTLSSLEKTWLAREATVDAATEILPGRPRQGRFRACAGLDLGVMAALPVTALISEVSRRHEVIRQMSAVLTADTAVARRPRLPGRAVRVSDVQWAIVMRARHPATPRHLALELGQSVFGITTECFRLVSMGLLAVTGPQGGTAVMAGEPDRVRPAISYIRALGDR
jgi:hypothetical protein